MRSVCFGELFSTAGTLIPTFNHNYLGFAFATRFVSFVVEKYEMMKDRVLMSIYFFTRPNDSIRYEYLTEVTFKQEYRAQEYSTLIEMICCNFFIQSFDNWVLLNLFVS